MRHDPESSFGEVSPAAAYLATLAPRSAETQAAALRGLATWLGASDPDTCPWHELGWHRVAVLRQQLASRYAPATANRVLAALRGVLLACRRCGLLDADTYLRLIDLRPVRGQAAPRGRMLDQVELAALFRACAADASPRGRRDAALIAVGVAGGLRRAELAALDGADVAGDGRISVRRGKGAKDRAVYLAGDARALLLVWQQTRADAPGPALFVAISRTGRLLDDRRLSPAAVRYILQHRCTEAGIAQATPHDLRRTFVSTLLDRGADIVTVAKLAGHASVDTTARYDRRGERAMREAADLITLE
jgi:site-specific recombinase XerD